MIKSFQELNTNRFTIMLEENPLSNIYNEIILTPIQEKEIIKIITKDQEGIFVIKCQTNRFIISDYEDTLEED